MLYGVLIFHGVSFVLALRVRSHLGTGETLGRLLDFASRTSVYFRCNPRCNRQFLSSIPRFLGSTSKSPESSLAHKLLLTYTGRHAHTGAGRLCGQDAEMGPISGPKKRLMVKQCLSFLIFLVLFLLLDSSSVLLLLLGLWWASHAVGIFIWIQPHIHILTYFRSARQETSSPLPPPLSRMVLNTTLLTPVHIHIPTIVHFSIT